MAQLIEYKRVRNDDPLSVSHLKRVYDTLYQDLFPDESLRENWAQWSEYLNESPDENFFILSGIDLDNPERAVLYGFVVGVYFKPSHTGLMCYIGVDPACRAGGIASNLIAVLTAEMNAYAQKTGHRLNGLFAEVCDPAQIKPGNQDDMPPETRLKIYHRWRAVQVPVEFCCPMLHAPWRKQGGLLLLSLPVYDRYAGPQDIIGMIADYYGCFGLDPATDTDFARIRGEMADWHG